MMARGSLVPALISASTREEIGAEFVEVDRQVQDFAPVTKRHKQLQEIIRGWYADFPAEQPAVFEGPHYRIHIGARGDERFLSLKSKLAIFKELGKAKAIEIFSVTLKAVEDALGKQRLEELTSKAPTGSRKLVPVLKAPTAKTGKAA